MGKSKYAAGTLIRRLTNDVPTGPWMIITKSTRLHVYAQTVNSISDNYVLLMRKNVWIPKVKHLAISAEKIEEIEVGEICITHPVTKKWMDVYKDQPDLIMFYTADGWPGPIYCTIDGVKYTISNREPIIRIIIDRVIL